MATPKPIPMRLKAGKRLTLRALKENFANIFSPVSGIYKHTMLAQPFNIIVAKALGDSFINFLFCQLPYLLFGQGKLVVYHHTCPA